MATNVLRSEQHIYYGPTPTVYYGWNITMGDSDASVHPFRTPGTRDLLVASVQGILTQAGSHARSGFDADDIAAILALNRWPDADDQGAKEWASDWLEEHCEDVSEALFQLGFNYDLQDGPLGCEHRDYEAFCADCSRFAERPLDGLTVDGGDVKVYGVRLSDLSPPHRARLALQLTDLASTLATPMLTLSNVIT